MVIGIDMLEEIIQQCYTGFGDCITGYVSSYLFKSILEKHVTHQPIRLSIDWRCVHCPYIRPEHLYQNRMRNRRTTASLNSLYSGEDGTLAFQRYYKTPRMYHDLQHKNRLYLIINQYIGNRLVDSTTTRDEIKSLTYEAYQYFWTQVLDQETINGLVSPHVPDHIGTVIYVRLGDQYLCAGKETSPDELNILYQKIDPSHVRLQEPVTLIGDLDGQIMPRVFSEIHPEIMIAKPEESGPVVHTCGQISQDAWIKVFVDLYKLLNSKQVIVLSYYSNFTRIVLFLQHDKEIYMYHNEQLQRVEDPSSLFAKHYIF